MTEIAPIPDRELLPWLVPEWERLCQARASDRLPHALLLVGPRGIGKRWLGRLLAEALLCANPLPDGRACGVCQDCRLSAAGSHPDLRRVVPDSESKSGEIGIAAVRAMTEWASLTAGRGARKQVVIDPADRLNAAAANALLKTLEEPPGALLLCLVAEQPERLPATIRSRCQLIRLGIPPWDQALAWLTPGLGGDTQAAAVRLGLARGAPLRALGELEPTMLEQHARLRASLAGMARGELDPVREADGWNGTGARLSLDWLAGWLCDLVRLAAAGPGARLDDPGSREAFSELGPRLDCVATHRLLRRVFEARGLTDTTVNPLLLLESLLIVWSRLNGH
jgi:DNA polymerase-3 subunit delta'